MKRAHHSVRAASILAAAGLAGAAQAQTNTFIGLGGNWYLNQNWSLGIWPQPGHEVVIPQGVSGVSASGAHCAKITAQSPLSVGTGGTTAVQGASLIDFTTTGGFISAGPVTFTGDVSVQTSYTWQAAGGFTNHGTMNITSMPLGQTTLKNLGTIKVTGGPIFVANANAGLVNDATLELRSGGNLQSNGQFVNNATWRKVGATESVVQCNVSHADGLLTVQDGVLRLTGGGFYNAPIHIQLGGEVRLEGPFVNFGHFFESGSYIDGDGELEVQCAGGGAVQLFTNLNVKLLGDNNGLHMVSGGVTIAPQNRQMFNSGRLRWDGGAFEGPGWLINTQSSGRLTVPAGRNVPANDAVRIWNMNFATAIVDGVLSLNDDSEFRNNSNLTLRGEFRGASGLVIVGEFGSMRADAGSGSTAKIFPRIQIEGGGTVNVETGTLSLLGGGTLKAGTLASTQQGTLLGFDFGTYQVTGTGALVSSAQGSAARIRGAGTVVNVQAGQQLRLEGAGSMDLEMNAQLGGPGTIINAGNFTWNSQIGVNGQAKFRNEGSQGNSVLIPAGGARLRGTFTNTIPSSVVQQGTLDMAAGTVDNQGDWVIQPASGAQIGITGVGGVFYNQFGATISAEAPPMAGHSAQISTTLDNEGIVQAIGGITLTINGQLVQLQNGALSGGTWQTADGGRIILPGTPPITKLKNASVVGSQQGMPWLAGVRDVEGGRLYAEGDITFTGPLSLDDDEFEVPSVMRIGPGAEVTVPGETTVGSPQQATMSYFENRRVDSLLPDPPMLFTPVLTMYGGIRPGGADEPGPFNLTGQLAMQPSGVIEVEIGGLTPETEHDAVTITGGATLAGTLDLALVNDFIPNLGQVFDVLTATGGVTGAFATVSQPASMPAGLALTPIYTENGVTLRVEAACYPDCNADGALNLADFGCFQTKFALGDPYADCNADGVLNLADFGCFQTRFALGCP